MRRSVRPWASNLFIKSKKNDVPAAGANIPAAGAAFRAGNQVAIEMIVDMMPKKMQKAVSVLISVVVLAVVGYLFYQSLGYISVFLKSGRATPMLKIPYSVIYGIAPVSYVLMVVSYFYALIKGVKSEAKEALDL